MLINRSAELIFFFFFFLPILKERLLIVICFNTDPWLVGHFAKRREVQCG